LTGLNTVTAHDHIYNTFNAHFSLSVKMDSSIVADITQLSDIPKSMGYLFLLETLKKNKHAQ